MPFQAVDPVLGEPERRLRVSDVVFSPHECRGQMATGPWCTVDGEPTAGALGVLADDVLGWLPAQWSPPDTWAMSTELRVQMRGALPVDGSALRCEASSDGVHGRGVLATGTILDAGGALVADASMRLFFVTAARPGQPPLADEPPGDGDLLAQLEGRIQGAARDVLVMDTGVGHRNPVGVMHGGISFAATGAGGMAALRAVSPGLVASAVHVVFARAIPVGGQVAVRSTVLHVGRAHGVVRVDGYATDGTVCTLGTVTAYGRPPQE